METTGQLGGGDRPDGTVGGVWVFFRVWLVSLLLGEDLWVFFTVQMTQLLNWGFEKVGWLIQPSLTLVQVLSIVAILINSFVYVFVVHLGALVLLDRLGNPIPRPPQWIQQILALDSDDEAT